MKRFTLSFKNVHYRCCDFLVCKNSKPWLWNKIISEILKNTDVRVLSTESSGSWIPVFSLKRNNWCAAAKKIIELDNN